MPKPRLCDAAFSQCQSQKNTGDLKKRSLHCRVGIFCDLQSNFKKKVIALQTCCFMPFAGCEQKKRHRIHTKKKHRNSMSFCTSQSEKRRFILVNNFCKNAEKYFTLFVLLGNTNIFYLLQCRSTFVIFNSI